MRLQRILLVDGCVKMKVGKHGCDVLDSRVYLRNLPQKHALEYFFRVDRASSKHLVGRILESCATTQLLLGFA